MHFSTIPMEAVLTKLEQISHAINNLQIEDISGIQATLALIAGSIADLLPESLVTIDISSPLKEYMDSAGGQKSIAAGKSLDDEEKVRYPLRVMGEELGALNVGRNKDHPLHAGELSLIDHMASLAAMTLSFAYQSMSAQQEQAGRERELRRLRRAGMLISSRSSLTDTLDAILTMALEVTDAIYGIFRLVDASGTNLVTQSFVGAGLEKPATEVLPINTNSIMGLTALKREPIIISDLRNETWNGVYYPLDHVTEMRSEVAVPLIGASGRLEGVLNLESPEVNAFNKEDRYMLQILATQAVVAIQEVRLLDTLQSISAMLYTCSKQQIHQALAERACDLLNVPTSAIWLVDADELVIQASSDVAIIGKRIPFGNDPVSRVIKTGGPLTILDISRAAAFASAMGLGGQRSALFVPLFTSGDDAPVGVFSVCTTNGDKRDFSQSDWDKKVLSILGHYAALAIQNASHLEALKSAEDQRATTETFAAIGDIAANLLHRLNNKIGTIPVRVEGIQDKCEDLLQSDAYLADNLKEIQSSASLAMQIVRESLEHLRPIQLSSVSVSASVREALATINLPPTVRVESFGLDDLPPVQAGANRLSLVFSNLLENAADAMEKQGKIVLQGSVHDKWVEVRITDDGPGISPDLHERIFEFNYSSRSSAHPGKLGFGLWWVKSLMTRFGGKVSIENAGSKGTTFILNLPLARGEL